MVIVFNFGLFIGIELSQVFLSTIQFYKDLLQLCRKIDQTSATLKLEALKTECTKLNKNLPGFVYLPFFKESIRNHAILNIVVDECKMYNTKERCPFYLCFEIFRPEEIIKEKEFEKIYKCS